MYQYQDFFVTGRNPDIGTYVILSHFESFLFINIVTKLNNVDNKSIDKLNLFEKQKIFTLRL